MLGALLTSFLLLAVLAAIYGAILGRAYLGIGAGGLAAITGYWIFAFATGTNMSAEPMTFSFTATAWGAIGAVAGSLLQLLLPRRKP